MIRSQWLVRLLLGLVLVVPRHAVTQAVPRGLSYLTPPTLSVFDQSGLPPPVATDVPLGDGVTGFGTRSFAFGDVNGDGLNDLVVVPSYGRYLPLMPLQLWINQGNGYFVDRTTDVIDGPVPVINNAQVYFIADFNGDSRPDVVIVESGLEDTIPPRGGKVILLLSQPNGKLADRSATIAGNVESHYQSAAMGDINGDGTLDLILSRPCQIGFEGCGVLFFLNDGRGQFSPSVAGLPQQIAYYEPWCCPSSPFQLPNAIGVGDLDGDGRLDLVTGSGSWGDDFAQPAINVASVRTIRVHQQQGDGSFVERARVPIPVAIQDAGYISENRFDVNPPVGLAALEIATADLNGDGRPDLVVLWEGFASHIEILRNDGNFQFTDVTLEWFGTYVSGRGRTNVGLHRVVDANGDGSPDLVFGTPSYGTLPDDLLTRSFIFLNDGTGHFSPWTLRLHGQVPTSETLTALIACEQCNPGSMPLLFDANRDGLPDVVLIRPRHTAAHPVREETLFLHTFLADPGQDQTLRIQVNADRYRQGDAFAATLLLGESITRPFTAFAVVILPTGAVLNALTLDTPLRPVATAVPGLAAPFAFPLLSATIPSGAPRGTYEIVVALFDPTMPITGRGDAFLLASETFVIE